MFSGGIYRDVYLTETDALHVAWQGVTITTPQVSARSATVRVQTELRNGSTATRPAIVRQTILDPDSIAVAAIEANLLPIAAGTITIDQTLPAIDRPQLWHPDHPNLYTVRTELLSDGRLIDSVETPLGFRWFEWTADRGFFLNGEHLYLRGERPPGSRRLGRCCHQRRYRTRRKNDEGGGL
ncbi:MAG: hypothetical protein QM770_14355 [Tepidisphaeraceae bacterium]